LAGGVRGKGGGGRGVSGSLPINKKVKEVVRRKGRGRKKERYQG